MIDKFKRIPIYIHHVHKNEKTNYLPFMTTTLVTTACRISSSLTPSKWPTKIGDEHTCTNEILIRAPSYQMITIGNEKKVNGSHVRTLVGKGNNMRERTRIFLA